MKKQMAKKQIGREAALPGFDAGFTRAIHRKLLIFQHSHFDAKIFCFKPCFNAVIPV
jgi:hypothetical protein